MRSNDLNDKLSTGLHWPTPALPVAVVALVELRGFCQKGSGASEAMKFWLDVPGLVAVGLVFGGMAVRFGDRGSNSKEVGP